MKAIALSIALLLVLFGVGIAHAMGGAGGGSGFSLPQQSGSTGSSTTGSGTTGSSVSGSGATGSSATGGEGSAVGAFYCQYDPGPGTQVTAIPEPITALLIGCGLMGLAGIRRKLAKKA